MIHFHIFKENKPSVIEDSENKKYCVTKFVTFVLLLKHFPPYIFFSVQETSAAACQ